MDADEGLDWQPLGPGRVPAWARLLRAIDTADGDDDHASEQDLTEYFADPRHDFPRGSVAVSDGELLVGFGLVESRVLADGVHAMRHTGGVHPAYRGRGIGRRIVAWAQDAAASLHQARQPGHPLSLTTGCLGGNAGAAELFAAAGFARSRCFLSMTRDLTADLPVCPVPAGVRIAGFTAERSPDARMIRNEAFADHWGPAEVSIEEWAHVTGQDAFRPGYSFLAYAGAEPLGVVIGCERDPDAPGGLGRDLDITVVGTRRAGRRRGIASALISHSLRAARDDGYTTASLGVDADSLTGAVGVYQRLGFATAASRVLHTKWLIP